MGVRQYNPQFHFLVSSRQRVLLSGWLLFLILLAATQSSAAMEVERVYFQQSSDHVLISYSVRHDAIDPSNGFLQMRIFGNGVVKVERPSYMKGAGSYEMQLDEQELQTLCRDLIKNGVMSYNENYIRESKRQWTEQQGIVYKVSDNSEVEINLSLNAIKVNGRVGLAPVSSRHHKIKNLRAQSRQYPGVVALTNMAKAESRLMEFVYSSRLRAIN